MEARCWTCPRTSQPSSGSLRTQYAQQFQEPVPVGFGPAEQRPHFRQQHAESYSVSIRSRIPEARVSASASLSRISWTTLSGAFVRNCSLASCFSRRVIYD